MRTSTRIVVVLAILTSIFSFFKFSHCESNIWAGPDQYIHACYSDLPALFSTRVFGDGQWAFDGGDEAVRVHARAAPRSAGHGVRHLPEDRAEVQAQVRDAATTTVATATVFLYIKYS